MHQILAEIIEIDLAETGLDFTEIQLPSSSIVGFGLGKKVSGLQEHNIL